MTQEKIKNLEKNETARRLMNFLPNELGINLSSVKDIIINRQEDGQIKTIEIIFCPTNNEKTTKTFEEKSENTIPFFVA